MQDRTPCPLCESVKTEKTSVVHVVGDTEYSLNACSQCTVQFWTPFVNPGATWYESDERYSDRNQDPILTPNEKHRGVVAYFGDKAGRVLDVGCGTGNFLVHAESKGWEGWGIDFDADAIASGTSALGLTRLSVANVQEFSAAHQGLLFDLITFFDVIEHLDDHTSFMQEVRELLTEKGHVALSVPYRHCWRWLIPHDLPPRHLTRWDEVSMTRFLERHGFTVTYAKRLPVSFYYLVMKMRFRYGGWASFGLVRKAKLAETLPTSVSKGKGHQSSRVQLIQSLAKTKDMLLFGIPAGILWIGLLFTRARYTDIYVVAQAK